MFKLYIGNKNYSSWSMRPWVLMKQAGIPFEEWRVRFDSFEPDSTFKQSLRAVTPAGKVPVLVDDGLVIWDTLAIAEYLNEQLPDRQLWPADKQARARARSVCAEMHSGLAALRGTCPMNIEASIPQVGPLAMRDNPAVRADVERIFSMWTELLQQHGGPMLFGAFSIADAFFAPVCMRFVTYGFELPAPIRDYVERVRALPGVKAWIDDALAEHDFREFEERYRLAPDWAN